MPSKDNLMKSYRLLIEPLLLLALLYFILVKQLTGGNIGLAAMQPWGVALFLMIINVIYVEYFFPTPRNGLINALNAFIIALTFLNKDNWLSVNIILSFILTGLVFFCAVIYLYRYKNMVKLDFLATIASKLGSAKVIFPLITYISYLKINEGSIGYDLKPFLLITFYLFIFIVVTTKGFNNLVKLILANIKAGIKGTNIGIVKSILTPNMILVDFKNKSGVNINDLISVGKNIDCADVSINKDEEDNLGIVLDIIGAQKDDSITARIYLLNEPQKNINEKHNYVVKINSDCFLVENPGSLISRVQSNKIKYYWDRKKDIVGIVAPFSSINMVNVEILRHQELTNAELVGIISNNPMNPIRYQIIEAETQREAEENKKDYGFTRFTAYQLGEWRKPFDEANNEIASKFRQFFEYQWVPQINTLVFRWNPEHDEINIEETDTDMTGCYLLGKIPKSKLPIYVRLKDIASHHTAILGVTGSGKSTLVHKLVNNINAIEILVLCIDITGEYKNKISNAELFFDENTRTKFAEIFIKYKKGQHQKDADYKSGERITPSEYDKIEAGCIAELNKIIKERIIELRVIKKVVIVEMQDMSNTKNSIDFTHFIIQGVLEYGKSIYESNIGKEQKDKDVFSCCLVLEEAHTLVPENIGVGGRYSESQAMIDKISQIALQGRKYNVGFILISQRTATVKKTVLNQCNTMISFRAYDETSFNFLTSYYGEKYVKEISHLKNDGDSRYIIAAGKAVIADRPVIVEIKE